MKKNNFFNWIGQVQILWEYTSYKRRKQIYLLQFLSCISAFAEFVNLAILYPFIQIIVDDEKKVKLQSYIPDSLLNIFDNNLTNILSIAFFLIVTLSIIIKICNLRFQEKLAANISTEMGTTIFGNIIRLPYIWHTKNNSSKTIGYLTKDVENTHEIIKSYLIIMVNLIIILFMILSITFLIETTLNFGLIIIIVSPISILIYYLVNKNQTKYGRIVINNYEKSIKIASEALNSIRDVITNNLSHFFIFNFNQKYKLYYDTQSTIKYRSQMARYLVEGVLIIGFCFLGLYIASTNDPAKGISSLGVIILGSYKLFHPLQLILVNISKINAYYPSVDRIKEFFSTRNSFFESNQEKDIYQKSLSVEKLKFENRITLKQLIYAYEGSRSNILSNINLEIKKGENIVIVGRSGSGKSTLIDILLGLLEPINGNLFIDDKSLKNKKFLKQWRKKISHVSQQIALHDGSIAENIAFGIKKKDIQFKRLIYSAQKASLSNFIDSLPNGLETIVGEKGVKLSGGQRQRIAIARAIYKSCEVLILDEATSALDLQTEKEVLNNISEIDNKLTTIAVAHRPAAIMNYDRIIHVHKGIIIGDGKFDDLIKENNIFKEMYEKNI